MLPSHLRAREQAVLDAFKSIKNALAPNISTWPEESSMGRTSIWSSVRSNTHVVGSSNASLLVSSNDTNPTNRIAAVYTPWPSPVLAVFYFALCFVYFFVSYLFVQWILTPPEEAHEADAEAVAHETAAQVGRSDPASAEEKDVIIRVEDMMCSSCVSSVEEIILQTPGVLRASVSLVSKSAKVTFDDTINKEQIADVITKAGFPARVMKGSEVTRSAFNKDHDEARVSRRLFLGSLVYTLPVLIIMYGVDLVPSAMAKINKYIMPGLSVQNFLLFLLATPVQFGFGLRFYRSAYYALRNCHYNMDVLICLGSSTAYLTGVVLILDSMANSHDATMVGHHNEGNCTCEPATPGPTGPSPQGRPAHELPCSRVRLGISHAQATNHTMLDASPTLISVILGGKAIEAMARGQATTAMRALLELQPPTALCAQPFASRDGPNSRALSVSLPHPSPLPYTRSLSSSFSQPLPST